MNVIRRYLRGIATVDIRGLATPVIKALRGGSRRYRFGTGRPPSSIRSARFVGATERFGAELRAMRQMQVSPELISDIETELQWGLIWHEFERLMQAEIDRVFAPYLAIAECEDFEELRDLVGLADAEPQLEREAVLV